MPSNKNQKNKPNGFIMYANEIRDELLREGHVIRCMPDLIAVASPRWNALPEEEQEYYKDRAKWEWENRNKNPSQNMKKPVRPDRRDCNGAIMSDRVDKVMLNEDRRRRERIEVFSSWPQGRGVTERSFYILSFICLLEEPTKYQPIEVAVVEFSLLGGILRTWHKHINPGKIEMGYQYQAQQISETTHLIPVTGIADPKDTYTSIYDELLQFISRGTNHIPPIHVKMSDCEKVEECLKWLARNAGRPNQLKRIYELEGLILDLDFHLNGLPQDFLRSKQQGTDLISSTIFDWDSESKCSFHQENETKYCARGFVQKYCFLMARFFCEIHCIPSTERHQPIQKKEKLYTLINSSSKEKSKAKSREEMERDMIAREVALKLSNFAMKEEDDDIERKVLEDERLKQEQKKRWLSLRGGTDSESVASDSTIEGSSCMSDVDQAPKPVFGRGRGRGMNAGHAFQSLRRPGDMGPSGKGQLPFGRGTKMYTGN